MFYPRVRRCSPSFATVAASLAPQAPTEASIVPIIVGATLRRNKRTGPMFA
jgi:hypothetical protein